MTYCVAVTLDDGMVFASDSRTNAGVDNVATFRKMYQFVTEGDRVVVRRYGHTIKLLHPVGHSYYAMLR